jgi:hypothetical protein
MATPSSNKRLRGGSGEVEDDQSLDLLNSVADFQKIDNPEIKDLSSLLIKFIKFSVENKRLDRLEENLNDLEEEVHIQKLNIANNKAAIELLEQKFNSKIEALTNEILEWKNKCETLELNQQKTLTTNNVLLQNKLDNDIIIRGFPAKPDSKTVCDNFLSCFQLDNSVIRSQYYFQFDSKYSKKTSHNVILSFKEIETKMNILQRKKDLGPILLSRLQPGMSASSSCTVTYSNRLSKFNLHAIFHLNKAKENKLIHSVRYHNLCFQIKESEKSGWLRISNNSELKKYKCHDQED